MARTEIDRLGFHLQRLLIHNTKTNQYEQGNLTKLRALALNPSLLSRDEIAEAEVFIKPDDLFSEQTIEKIKQGRDAIAKKILEKEVIIEQDRKNIEYYFRLKAISDNLSKTNI